MSSRSNANGLSRNADSSLEITSGVAPKRGMVLPFTPLAMSFDSVNYYVDMPQVREISFSLYTLYEPETSYYIPTSPLRTITGNEGRRSGRGQAATTS